MTSSYSFLAKILGMTSSSNANERKVAEEKLQEQLKKYGLTKEELDAVVYEVYHHMNLNSLRKQAEEKIHEYVHALFPQCKSSK